MLGFPQPLPQQHADCFWARRFWIGLCFDPFVDPIKQCRQQANVDGDALTAWFWTAPFLWRQSFLIGHRHRAS